MAQISEGERIVKLMLFIREDGPVTLAAIRHHFPFEYGEEAGSEQSTRRRFERDKKTLQDLGIFLTIDDQQRYALDAQKSFAAPVSLTQAQVSLLRLLCGALLEDEDYPFKEDLRMVLVKLGDELEIPDMLPGMGSGAVASGKTAQSRGFDKVRKAISTRKLLRFEYLSPSGKVSSREVEPFGCFFLKGICYVVADDPQADGTRCFRIDRMSKISLNSSKPGTPDFEERSFNAADYYGLPFQFGDEPFTARIEFDGDSERKARGISMGMGEFEMQGDLLIWTVEGSDPQALAQWCIENGPDIRILEPAEAAILFSSGTRAFLDRLDKEGGSA